MHRSIFIASLQSIPLFYCNLLVPCIILSVREVRPWPLVIVVVGVGLLSSRHVAHRTGLICFRQMLQKSIRFGTETGSIAIRDLVRSAAISCWYLAYTQFLPLIYGRHYTEKNFRELKGK